MVRAHPRRRPRLACALVASAALAALGCDREERDLRPARSQAARTPLVDRTPLHVGGRAPPEPGTERPRARRAHPMDERAFDVGRGAQLFVWFNCNGCHASGGGGMGPALMDAEWIYGHEPGDIFASIVGGRPNGMPSYRGKIADYQVWQLTAYVRSLSGLVPLDAQPGRSDHLSAYPPPSMMPGESPRAGGRWGAAPRP